jgi:mono/diheme cytochrome c family protein
MRRRLIPVNVVIAALLFILLSLDPDQSKPPQVVMERGRAAYEKECLSCHQQDGLGVLGPKQQLIKIVLNGLTEPVTIDGDVFLHPMSPHTHLTDQEIADVLSYVRNSFGNKASAVTAREVKKVRVEKNM